MSTKIIFEDIFLVGENIQKKNCDHTLLNRRNDLAKISKSQKKLFLRLKSKRHNLGTKYHSENQTL